MPTENELGQKTTEEAKAEELAASKAAAAEKEVADAKAAADAAAKEAADKAKQLEADKPKADKKDDPDEEEEETEKPTSKLDTERFTDTNSEVGNSVLILLQDAGATQEQAKALLFDAVASNDMSKVDRAALVAIVGEAQANIVLTGAKAYAGEIAAANQAVTAEITGAVGSMDNWKQVQEWATNTDSLTDVDMKSYNDMIKAGGTSARLAATDLLGRFNADAGNTQITDTPRVTADVDTSSTSEAITAKEAYKRLELAERRGEDPAPIRAARARGRAKGI